MPNLLYWIAIIELSLPFGYHPAFPISSLIRPVVFLSQSFCSWFLVHHVLNYTGHSWCPSYDLDFIAFFILGWCCALPISMSILFFGMASCKSVEKRKRGPRWRIFLIFVAFFSSFAICGFSVPIYCSQRFASGGFCVHLSLAFSFSDCFCIAFSPFLSVLM